MMLDLNKEPPAGRNSQFLFWTSSHYVPKKSNPPSTRRKFQLNHHCKERELKRQKSYVEEMILKVSKDPSAELLLSRTPNYATTGNNNPAPGYKFLRQFSVDQKCFQQSRKITAFCGKRIQVESREAPAESVVAQDQDQQPAQEQRQHNLHQQQPQDSHGLPANKSKTDLAKNRINLNIVLNSSLHDQENGNDTETESNNSAKKDDKQRQLPIRPSALKKVDTPKTCRSNLVSTTAERIKPRLVRAMSAPTRSIDDPKNQAKNSTKKPVRRRRIVPKEKDDNLIPRAFSRIDFEEDEEEDCFGDKSKKPPPKPKNLFRARSAHGQQDIVTLVSLVSLHSSDSEREDGPPTDFSVNSTGKLIEKTQPFLRKTGKSVSFQEHENQNYSAAPSSTKDLIRRGSVTPLAMRIRANRPPTAPPGSIFIKDYDTSDNMARRQSMARVDNSATKVDKDRDSSMAEVPSSDDLNNLKTAKERECWKLYQKMTNRGISVSYDTILRGMMTPTEYRVLLSLKKDQQEAAVNEEPGKIDSAKS